MKIRPSVWEITWRYLIFSVIIAAAVFGMFFTIFFPYDSETKQLTVASWGVFHHLIVYFTITVIIFFYIVSITSYYYVIESKYFLMKRFGKEIAFEYKNIQFIDIEASRKKKQVIFYTTKARTKYLIGDKDGVLLETLIKKCPNIMSVEEFRRKHPEERY